MTPVRCATPVTGGRTSSSPRNWPGCARPTRCCPRRGCDDQARLAADRVWIVDPLDGTREFGEPGRTDWAVHVALWQRGTLTAGAVALPAQGRGAQHRRAARAAPARPAPGAPVRVVVSRTRPPAFLTQLATRVPLELIPLGSAGAKAAAVISGDADAYLHSGGQYEWDSAAPVAVAVAAGLHASRLDGSPLAYNQADPSLPDILICPEGLAATLLEGVCAVGRLRSPVAARQARPHPGEPAPVPRRPESA